mgnify:FL=1
MSVPEAVDSDKEVKMVLGQNVKLPIRIINPFEDEIIHPSISVLPRRIEPAINGVGDGGRPTTGRTNGHRQPQTEPVRHPATEN